MHKVMVMEFSLRGIFCVLLLAVFTSMKTEETRTKFHLISNHDGQICAGSDRIIQISVRSKIECTQLCASNLICYGVFFHTASSTCTACSGYANLQGQHGTIFLTQLGCLSSHGSGCLPYSKEPHVTDGRKMTGEIGYCFCDMECYEKGDCCFDVNC